MDNQQEPTVQHMDLCSMLCGGLNVRGFGGEWVHVHVWLRLFIVHLNYHNFVGQLYPNIKEVSSKNKTKKKKMHPYDHSNTIHNTQDMETT